MHAVKKQARFLSEMERRRERPREKQRGGHCWVVEVHMAGIL